MFLVYRTRSFHNGFGLVPTKEHARIVLDFMVNIFTFSSNKLFFSDSWSYLRGNLWKLINLSSRLFWGVSHAFRTFHKQRWWLWARPIDKNEKILFLYFLSKWHFGVPLSTFILEFSWLNAVVWKMEGAAFFKNMQ